MEKQLSLKIHIINMKPADRIKTIDRLSDEFSKNLQKRIVYDKKKNDGVITDEERAERNEVIQESMLLLERKNAFKKKHLLELIRELDEIGSKIVTAHTEGTGHIQKKNNVDKLNNLAADIYLAISKINRS
jgi:hypothetical protein